MQLSKKTNAPGPNVTVVMPTHNRRDILARTLSYYANQTIEPGTFEVVVADDGSNDGTEAMVASLQPALGYELIYCKLPGNAGPSAARNRAILEARGQILILVGDDIFPAKDFLQQHQRWHRELYPQENVGVLGLIRWANDLDCTPLMRWLDQNGTQFAYGAMVHGQHLDYGYLYTSNVSVKRSFIERTGHLLEERLRFCEDSEWGFRLFQAGFELRYNSHAQGEHFHPVTLSSSLKRMIDLGKSAGSIAEINLDNFRRITNAQAYENRPVRAKIIGLLLHPLVGRLVYRPLAALCERRFFADRIFAACHASYFRKGLMSTHRGHFSQPRAR
jgi:glycosyltransferase involved in cell wall biosynthesis